MGEDPYSSYYRAVELHWSLRREHQIIVSPIEFSAIESWYHNQIPVAVVNRAIDQFIARKAKAKRKRGYLLTHVDRDVQRLFGEYQDLHTGMAEGESEHGIGAIINRLARKLNQLARDQPACEEQVLKVTEHINAMDLATLTSLEEVETELAKWDTLLIEAFDEVLSGDERRELQEDLENFVESDDPDELRARVWRDMVRYHFDIPRLTVLGN